LTAPQPAAPDDEPPREHSSILTFANALTLLRLVLAPWSAILIASGDDLFASGIFAVAVATDLADGPLARRVGGASPFGALLDHGSDAIFVTLGLGALAMRGIVPPVLPPLIVLAFVQYTLDSRALAGKRLRTSFLGRWNGILYFALLGTPIIRNALGLSQPSDGWVFALAWLLALSTGVSMLDRLAALRRRSRA
jgi:phosphatidylglycerophosphate synthase